MERETNFSVGEWVVHCHYGVGQIRKTEIMPLHGEQTECFKVHVRDGDFWFPTNAVANSRIRPVASQEMITKAIKNLRRKPGNIEKDKKYWTERIKTVPSDCDLVTISKLVRDLSAQQALKKLNDTQIRALSKFKDRLLHEWAAITGEEIEKIRPRFRQYIRESKAKINDE
jgi:RNA polymerase-interacting CarD/CdnL/TRCF family regulator